MKLKKIASLMLAGVMAISMLAGCSGKGETKPEEPATGVNANTVIAALDKDTTKNVTFTASASLQATAEKAVTYVNDGVVSKFDVSLLKKVDTKLSDGRLPAPGKSGTTGTTGAQDSVAQSYTFVVNSGSLYGASDKATVDTLAKAIAAAGVSDGGIGMSALPTESGNYAVAGVETYKFDFAYTADVAVVSTANDNGQVTYYAVVTLTRTPTRTAVEA